ncbi:hypothetical protein FNAPI_12696 [Fusarium napiforme]|uniref:Uncharacterized protein n=1 Tax=Fusarium napiforme TaxID=42672 RepID=A0A8H5IA40_9HYPO|nr:hypothetical protein FNAPI_12696 [Fusarium napiforme]
MNENQPPPGESSQDAGLPVTPKSQHTQAEVGDGSQLLPIDLVNDSVSSPNQAQAPPIRRGRGRPRGSKNKKTLATESAPRQPQRRFPSPAPAPALGDERDCHQSWMGDAYAPSNYGDSPNRGIDTSQLGRENDLASPDPYESQALADFLKSYRNSVHLAREKNRQSATISRERMREEEQYKLAKLIDSHTWSQAQEDELDASWESGLVKAAILRLPDRGTCLSSVFETSFHLCNMDPLSLLSLYHNFEFDNSGSESFLHVICRADDGKGFSTEEASILSHLGCGNLSVSPVLECFRLHQERSKTAGFITTPHAKLLALIADQAGLRAVPTSAEVMLVRTGDLDVIIGALDRLNDCGTSRTYPSGLEELLEEYKWVWMKLERNKLCNAAVNPPAAQSNMLYRVDGPEVPAHNVFLPNKSVLGGFPRNPQQGGHFKAEGSPIRRSCNPDAGDLTQNIAYHRDQLNPFQAFLTQPDRAQGNLRNPFAKQPDPSPAQESQMGGSEDGEIASIKLSDEEMMEEQLENVPDVPQAAGGHPRKRDQFRYQDRQRKFKTKKQRQRSRGGYSRSRSYAPPGRGGNNWAAGGGSGYERR